MNSTPISPIRRQSRKIIVKVIEDSVFGPVQCLPVGDVLELRKLLRNAYPFGRKAGWDYKVWCEEVRFALGYQIRKSPAYQKPILRKPHQVMPAMRDWARQQGILDESPETHEAATEELSGKVILEMRHMVGGDTWVETFDSSALTYPDHVDRRKPGTVTVTTVAGAKKWAVDLVRAFNRDLRPGEIAREVVSVRFIPNSPQP